MKWTVLMLLCLPFIATAQDPDRRSVYNTALDYLDGLYRVQPERIQKSVYPGAVKHGFYWKGKDRIYSQLTTLSYEQLVQVARDWNKSGWLPEDAPHQIDILDLQEKIATVKITAYWGIDYLLIAKMDSMWMITDILWQKIPQPLEEQNDGESR